MIPKLINFYIQLTHSLHLKILQTVVMGKLFLASLASYDCYAQNIQQIFVRILKGRLKIVNLEGCLYITLILSW